MCQPEPHWLSEQRVFCSCGCGLHDRRFMSQAGRTRNFARSARRVALRAKYRVRPAWLIKRLSCRLCGWHIWITKTMFVNWYLPYIGQRSVSFSTQLIHAGLSLLLLGSTDCILLIIFGDVLSPKSLFGWKVGTTPSTQRYWVEIGYISFFHFS